MGLFEQQPLLLIPLILAVVALYDGVKSLLKAALRSRVREPER